jgi:DNA-binding Lrp family transcriptional regulator
LAIGNTFLVNTFLLLKYGNQKKYVELNYAKFFTFDPQYFQDLAYKELVKIIVKYMLAIKTIEKEKFIELTNKLPEDMKQLVKEDYNYFQWDGIVEGLEKGEKKKENEVIKNGFMQGMSIKRMAILVNLTPKEVESRIREMQLTRASRARAGMGKAN